MGRTAKIVGGVAIVGVAAAAVVVLLGRGGSTPSAATDLPIKLATTTVSQRDLVTYDETTATLGFTTAVKVSSPVDGTITSIVAEGTEIDAGTVVASIDGDPVVAFVGDVPGFRDLDIDSTDGADVRQLEQNLILLGFDPDGDIVVDQTFDDATEAAVDRWEESLGLESDGTVPQGQIVYIPGRLLVDVVDAAVGSGANAGSVLLEGRQTERTFLVSATVGDGDGGSVGLFADPGTPVADGTVLFWQNLTPVVAIEGDAASVPALERDLALGVDDGIDVRLLEQMLVDGGFDPSGAISIDDHFDEVTAFAVAVWRQSLGLPATNNDGDIVVPKGSFVVVPAGLSVGRRLLANGDTAAGDVVAMTLTAPAREVTTTAPIGDETFALGATIDVEFPDGTVSSGTVVDVGNVASNTSGTPGDTPTVEITIQVDDIPASVDSFVQIPVTLRVVAEQIDDAFTVPVSALVALAEGGYALEVVTGSDATGAPTTRLMAVTPGLFTDGFVSVTGDGLTDGLTVVVPS